MKTVLLDFTANNSNFANITDEQKLIDKWNYENKKRRKAIKDGFSGYPGDFVQDECAYNGQYVVRVNLRFPLYCKGGDNKLTPKNEFLVCEIAAYVKSKLEISNTDTLHFVLVAHGINGPCANYCLSTGNDNSPEKGLLPSAVLSEVIKQFSSDAETVEITLVACNVDKGNFVKNFATNDLAKRFKGNIKINRFEGIVQSTNSVYGDTFGLKNDINKKMIPFLYDRTSLTDEGIEKCNKNRSKTKFPEILFMNLPPREKNMEASQVFK